MKQLLSTFAKKFCHVIFLMTIISSLPISNVQAKPQNTPLAASGDLTWAIRMGGTSSDTGESIAVDSSGNSYVTGRFSSTADFDPGAGTANLTSNGNTDIFISKYDSGGALVWAKQIGSTGQDYGRKIGLDSSNNIYVTGAFNGTADFNPNAGTSNLVSNGDLDIFIVKLDSNGNFIWAENFGSANGDEGWSLSIDTSNNVYLLVDFTGTVDFDPGVGTADLIGASTDFYDIAVVKLDNNGSYVWAKSFGNSNEEYAGGVAVDTSGNVFITGNFDGTVDFDPGAGTFNLTSSSYDMFVLTLDNNGNFVWAISVGGSGIEEGNAIAIDTGENIYVVGDFQDTVDFDPSAAGVNDHTSAGGWDAYVLKLTSNGNFVWAATEGGPNDDWAFGITLDSLQNIYFTGAYNGDMVDFDPGFDTTNLTSLGQHDIFVAKLTSNYQFAWAKSMGGPLDDYSHSIALDADNNVITTGWFGGEADFDPGAGTANLTSAGSSDIYLAKLEGTPTPIVPTVSVDWNTFLGGTEEDFARPIAGDNNGNIYIAGTSHASWGASPIGNYTAGQDIFVAKLNSSGDLIWHTFLGGSGNDSPNNIVLDNDGNIYVVGSSDASWGASPIRAYSAGGGDAFVFKLNSSGTLLWNTFLGGTDYDEGNSAGIDGNNNLYISGYSYDTWNVPVRPFSGFADSFIAKLDSSGNLTWNTFVGGSTSDVEFAYISVDHTGNSFITGYSDSSWGTPINAFNPLSDSDCYVARVDASGNLVWNTFLGGDQDDIGRSIQEDGNGNLYMSGESYGSWGTPIRAFASGSSYSDVFIAKLDNNGSLLWNTFLGSNAVDSAGSLSLDSENNPYVSGSSSSTWGTPSIPHTTSGNVDVFVARLTKSGALSWNAFVGTDYWHDGIGSVFVNNDNQVYVTGWSAQTWGFPIRAFTGPGTHNDGFVAKLSQSTQPTLPEISTITRTSTSPTSASNVDFTVTFSKTVQNVDTGDFSLTTTGVSGASITGVSGSGSVFTVTVDTGSGNGTIRLDVPVSASITDLASNPLDGLPFKGGETYLITKSPSFLDVPSNYWAFSWIERLYNSGITSGCGNGNYCPTSPVTRAQMAVFLEKGLHGNAFTPTDVSPTFNDTAGHWAEDWIEALKSDAITSGCGNGNYCPEDSVTRAQMAVFLLKAMHGSSYSPPVASPTFGDDAGHWAQNWIEELALEGITSGCGNGNYCPDSPVTRDQMAVFLVKAFGLP